MSTVDRPKFERAEKLEGMGRFILAGDLVDRGPEYIDHYGLVTDHISGQRPSWDFEVENYLRSTFPQFRHMWFEREPNPDPAKIKDRFVKMTGKWYGQSGYIYDKNQFYSVYGHVEPEERGFSRREFGIRDLGIPVLSRGEVNIQPTTHNGAVKLELTGVADKQQNPFWRGEIILTGEKPGRLITEVKDFIEQKITEGGYPLWRDRSWLPLDHLLRQRRLAAQTPPLP